MEWDKRLPAFGWTVETINMLILPMIKSRCWELFPRSLSCHYFPSPTAPLSLLPSPYLYLHPYLPHSLSSSPTCTYLPLSLPLPPSHSPPTSPSHSPPTSTSLPLTLPLPPHSSHTSLPISLSLSPYLYFSPYLPPISPTISPTSPSPFLFLPLTSSSHPKYLLNRQSTLNIFLCYRLAGRKHWDLWVMTRR